MMHGECADSGGRVKITPVLRDMLEVIILSLRTADGLHLPQFVSMYGTAATDKVKYSPQMQCAD